MEYFSAVNADHLIVYIYLFAMLVLGIWAGRGVNDMKDYAVANHSYSPMVMMLTLFATILGGGSTLGIAEAIHHDGLIMIIPHIGTIISYVLLARFIAPKVARFSDMISMGDMMGAFYGPSGKKLTGLLGFLYSIGILAAQCKAMGYILNVTFGFNEVYAVILGASVLLVYSTFGGIRSVTVTDIFQFGILIIVIPLIANVAVTQVGGVESLISSIPAEKFEIANHTSFWKVFVMFLVFGVFPTFTVSPAPVQRMLMTRNPKAISNIFYTAATMQIPFNVMILLIGFVAIVAFPDVDSGLAMPIIINESLPPILIGIAITGILAVVMSTADSSLNSGAILLVHDFLRPVFKLDKSRELFATKLATFIMGCIAIYMAIYAKSILGILFYVYSLWGPLIVTPFIFCVMGYSSSPRAFLSAAAVTIFTFITSQIFLPEGHKYWSGLICIIINAISFFYFTHRYCAENITLDPKYSHHAPKKINFNIFKSIKTFLSLNVVKFIDDKVQKIGPSYMAFAIFCCFSYLVPYFMWTRDTPIHYEQMLALRMLCGAFCIGLLLHSIWPKTWKKYFNIYWYFTLCFCLPFTTTVVALIQGFDMEWIVNIALSIFLLALLVDWVSFIIIVVVGSSLGHLYFFAQFPTAQVNLDRHQIYMMVYILIFSTLIGLIFSRKREVVIDGRIDYIKEETGVIAHNLKTPLSAVSIAMDTLKNILSETTHRKTNGKVCFELNNAAYKMLNDSTKLIDQSLQRGLLYIDNLSVTSSLEVPQEMRKILNIKDCLENALTMFKSSGVFNGELEIDIKNDIEFTGSHSFVSHLLLNLLNNSAKHGGDDVKIKITVVGNKVIIRDNGSGIHKELLPEIFNRGVSGASSTGLGLSFCKMVMEDVGGSISCASKLDKYTEFELRFD